MTAPSDPNWMTIAGLLFSTLGVVLIGRVLLDFSRLIQAGRPTPPTSSQPRLDTLFGLSLIAVGAGLQIMAQLTPNGEREPVALLLLTFIAVLMVYALNHGLYEGAKYEGAKYEESNPARRTPEGDLGSEALPQIRVASSRLPSTHTERPIAISSIDHGVDDPHRLKNR